MNNKFALFNYINKFKADRLDKIAEAFDVSEDFILGMIEDDPRYVLKDDNFLVLAGLGRDKCIICGGESHPDEKMIGVEVPAKYVGDKKLDPSLLEGKINGHAGCYNEIGLFFRFENIYCADCNFWGGAISEGDQIQERCNKWNRIDYSPKGVLEYQTVCNFFDIPNLITSPDSDSERKKWETVFLERETKTAKGYELLIPFLEKAHLIK